jgi:hypothetical protein
MLRPALDRRVYSLSEPLPAIGAQLDAIGRCISDLLSGRLLTHDRQPMKKIAIDKAQARLAKARESLARVDASRNFAEFESAWTDFLTATNSIYSVLEQGAKHDPRSRQWFGGKKNERRKDALLSYLHQARNADEHGIEPVAKRNPGHIAIGRHGEAVHIKELIVGSDGQFRGEFIPVNGRLPTIEIANPHAELVTVRDDRFGDSFDPPTEHLGLILADRSPLGVARLGFAYHAALVDAAASLMR